MGQTIEMWNREGWRESERDRNYSYMLSENITPCNDNRRGTQPNPEMEGWSDGVGESYRLSPRGTYPMQLF